MYVNNYMATTDVHVSGAPLRVFRFQAAGARHASMAQYLEELNRPPLKIKWKRLLEEPRGHNNMLLCIVTPPVSPGSVAGLLFKNTNGDLPVPVHGLIGIATVLAETEHAGNETCIFDSVDGPFRVDLDFDTAHEKAVQVKVKQTLEFGRISYDHLPFETIKWPLNKNRFVILPADFVRLTLTIEHLNNIQSETGRIFRRLAEMAEDVSHILLYERQTDNPYRFLTVDRQGFIDRSPLTGAGAFAAYLDRSGLISRRKKQTVSNFLGNQATVAWDGSETEQSENGVCSLTVGAQGFITGFHRFVVDATDPLKDGFLIR